MKRRPFQSIFFNEYFNKISGKKIEIDFSKGTILIFNENSEICSTIYFANKIRHRFTKEDLFNNQQNGKIYAIYLDGNDGKNWLWCGDITESMDL